MSPEATSTVGNAPATTAASRGHVRLAIGLAALVAFAAALFGVDARATYGAQTTADEPYYLVTAQSLADDGDLDIDDELAAQPLPYHEITLDEQTRPLNAAGQRLSPHDPLLPLLLAPAMAIGGFVAAKIALALLAGLAAALTAWVAVRRLGVSPRVAGIAAGAAFAAMPLASYGTQVYPELPAATVVLIGVAALTTTRWTVRARVVALLAVVALPWLAIKYAPVAAVLAVLALVRTWRDADRRAAAFDIALLAIAGLAYVVIHQRIYGGLTVYAVGDHFVDAGELSVVGTQANPLGRARRLVGLIVDRQFGLAAWAPIWLLGPPAVAAFVAARRDAWTKIAVIGPLVAGWLTATFVALTMHGFWSPGRQVVVVLPLAVLALAVLADRSRAVLAAVAGLGVAGAVNWIVLAREAATGGPTLVIDAATTSAWPYRLLAPLLPDGIAATGRDELLLAIWTVVAIAGIALTLHLTKDATQLKASRPTFKREISRLKASRPTFKREISRLKASLATFRNLRPLVVVLVSVVALAVVVPALVALVDGEVLRGAVASASGDVGGLLLALGAFAAAFAVRAVAWTRVLDGLGFGQALAGIHVALGANHVLPLRLGEPLRVVSVVRRTGVSWRDATASTVVLRSADIVVLLALGLVAGPSVMGGLLGTWGLVATSVVAGVGLVAGVVILRGTRTQAPLERPNIGALRLPDGLTMVMTTSAWLAEALLVWQVARWFGVDLTAAQSVVVLAAAVGAQLIAVAPGGLGTYEAAGSAALVAVGVDPGTALAVAIGIHATKTAYSIGAGLVGAVVPTPNLLGHWRLPTTVPPRPQPHQAAGPVVLFLPAFNEGPRVADVIARAPATIHGHDVEVVVVDDGSTDDTADRATAAGATIIRHGQNRGLGAAVRTGLAHATSRGAVAVAFCDADLEYDPADLADLVTPILDGSADYVLGSRFAGDIEHMQPHRRLGNQVLTRWLAWMVRTPVTDGQSGYRAFSPAAAEAAQIPHDYNYAQVLTIDLLRRGFTYHEVPIRYRFRESGDSFVRLGRYLRRVVPTVWRQLNRSPV